MRKIIILIIGIYIIIPILLTLNFLNINSFLSDNGLVEEYFKVILPMSLPTAALLLTLSRYREEDQNKLKEQKLQLYKDEFKKKEICRPYFSVKFADRKMQVFTSDGSPVLNVNVIYDFNREKIVEKGGMESSEVISIVQKNFDWLLLHAKTVKGEEIYFIYTTDTKTGSHYVFEQEKLISYSNGGDYEKSIVENYLDFVIIRKEYQRNYAIGELHKHIVQKTYNLALNVVIFELREAKDIIKKEKIQLLLFLYLFFDRGGYSVKKEFDRKYANSKSCNFNGIDWEKQFLDEEQDINNSFMALYILDIIDAYRNEKINSLDYLLRPIEVFVRDDSIIHDVTFIKYMEKLLLGDSYIQDYAEGLLEYLPFNSLEKLRVK